MDRQKNTRRRAASLLLLLSGAVVLNALPPQKILYPDDWAYEALGILSRESKTVFFADTVISVAQATIMLESVDRDALSPPGRDIFDRLASYLREPEGLVFQSDALTATVDLTLAGDLFYKTDREAGWIYDYYQREPLFTLPLNLSFGSWLSAGMEPRFAENETAALDHDNHTMIPLDPAADFDLHFPKRAYLSAGIPLGGASGIRFTLGTGENFLGKTRTGSIILSEYMERVSYGRLELFSPAIRYAAEVQQLQTLKYLYMHYLQLRPHQTLSVSLTEAVMVNAPLELRFLNPMMIFHNLESWKTYHQYNEDLANAGDAGVWDDDDHASRAGSFFGAKIEYQPIRYLRLYGLFGMSQLQLAIERENWGDMLSPNALAFQGGAEISLPSVRGYWNFGVEGVYTYPFMYLKWNKNWSYVKEFEEVYNMQLREWVGTPFGPDSIAGTLWATYSDMARWSLTAEVVFAAQGENADTAIFDDPNKYRPSNQNFDVVTPPTGIPVYTVTASLAGTWSPYLWLDLSIQPGYRYIRNAGHQDGKTAQSFELAFSTRVRPLLLKKTDKE